MILLSLCFACLAFLCCGRLLSRLFPQAGLIVSEQFVLGAGTLALATLVLALPGLGSLRLISLAVLSLPIVSVAILDFQSWRQINLKQVLRKKRGLAVAAVGLLLVPLSLFWLRVPPMGDDLKHWALIVKLMTAYDNLPRALLFFPASKVSGHPILGSYLHLNGLALYGDMHDGAGNVIMYLIFCMGALFVYERLKTRYSTTASLVAATIVYALVLLLAFQWYAAWRPEALTAVALLISSYRLVTDFSKREAPGWSSVAILSLSLTMLVSVRPDGFTYLPFAFLLGSFLLLIWRTGCRAKFVRLATALLGPGLLLVGWSVYISVLFSRFPGSAGFPIPPRTIASTLAVERKLTETWLLSLTRYPINPPLVVARGMVQSLVHFWFRLGPLVIGLLVAIALALLLFKRLDREEKALSFLVLVPAYRFLWLFAYYVLAVRQTDATPETVSFTRYLIQAGFALFFVLAFLSLKFLQTRQISIGGRYVAYGAITAAMITHLVVGFVLTISFSRDDYRWFQELAAVMKEKSLDLSPVQILHQDGPQGYRGRLANYYTVPDILTTIDEKTIGRPISTSSYEYINRIRKQMGIYSRDQYLNWLHDTGIKGILVLESDTELERIMELDLSPQQVYMFRVTQDGFEYQWSIRRRVFDAPSRRAKALAILSELGEVFRR